MYRRVSSPTWHPLIFSAQTTQPCSQALPCDLDPRLWMGEAPCHWHTDLPQCVTLTSHQGLPLTPWAQAPILGPPVLAVGSNSLFRTHLFISFLSESCPSRRCSSYLPLGLLSRTILLPTPVHLDGHLWRVFSSSVPHQIALTASCLPSAAGTIATSTPQLADVSVLWTPLWPLSGSQAGPNLLRTETWLFYLAGQKGTGLKQFVF